MKLLIFHSYNNIIALLIIDNTNTNVKKLNETKQIIRLKTEVCTFKIMLRYSKKKNIDHPCAKLCLEKYKLNWLDLYL